MDEKCTNTSGLPSLGAMNPNPLELLNHLTTPVSIPLSVLLVLRGIRAVNGPLAVRWLYPGYRCCFRGKIILRQLTRDNKLCNQANPSASATVCMLAGLWTIVNHGAPDR